MRRVGIRALALWTLIIGLVGGLSFFLYEYAVYSEQWAYAAGNPHLYDRHGLALGRVVDRDGLLLTDLAGGKQYSSNKAARRAAAHWVGDREGNVSLPYLRHYQKALVGFDPVNGIYAYGGHGGQMKLTLSSKVQETALEAMGAYRGTIAVYNYKTGQILCALSTPTFDPEVTRDGASQTEGLYWNRFIQSVYVPGSIFKIVTTAAALEALPDIDRQTFYCEGTYQLAGGQVTCERAHGKQDLQGAMLRSCNCIYAQIALQLGAKGMESYVGQFGVTQQVRFDGITTAAGNYEAVGASSEQLAWSAVGQYNDQINPCAFLAFVGAIANGGQGVMPHIVQKVTTGGKAAYAAKIMRANRIMSEKTALTLRKFMRNNVVNNYGAEHFPGLTVCAKTGTGQVGGSSRPNATFAGFVADEMYPLAFIMCAEDAGYGKIVCVPIVSKVLLACKEVIDAG